MSLFFILWGKRMVDNYSASHSFTYQRLARDGVTRIKDELPATVSQIQARLHMPYDTIKRILDADPDIALPESRMRDVDKIDRKGGPYCWIKSLPAQLTKQGLIRPEDIRDGLLGDPVLKVPRNEWYRARTLLGRMRFVILAEKQYENWIEITVCQPMEAVSKKEKPLFVIEET